MLNKCLFFCFTLSDTTDAQVSCVQLFFLSFFCTRQDSLRREKGEILQKKPDTGFLLVRNCLPSSPTPPFYFLRYVLDIIRTPMNSFAPHSYWTVSTELEEIWGSNPSMLQKKKWRLLNRRDYMGLMKYKIYLSLLWINIFTWLEKKQTWIKHNSGQMKLKTGVLVLNNHILSSEQTQKSLSRLVLCN